MVPFSGIGFGICQRLLFQLCHTSPSDALPQHFAAGDGTAATNLPSTYDGLTLIMACRSIKRAEAARTKLWALLDSYIAQLQRKPEYDGHAHAFRENVTIDIVTLDLAIISSVFKFANEVSAK